MVRLAGRGVVGPVDSAICQRCSHNNKCAREENSPVASRKKRETVTEMERESEDKIINVAKPQSQRPEIAPKPQPLSQRDPRLLASAARVRERESESERRKSGRSRERDEARDHSRSSSYTRIPDINYANTDKVQLHFYVKDSDDIAQNQLLSASTAKASTKP